MTDTKKQLNGDVEKASKELWKHEKAVRGEILDSTRLIKDKYRDKTDKLKESLNVAKRAERDYIDANTSHPWEGKRVVQEKDVGPVWSSNVKTLVGVVEVVRQDTEFPLNVGRFNKPSLGATIVRAIKKDGTAGLKIHSSYWTGSTRLEQEWSLKEGES